MNREQRRRAAREKETIVNIPLKDLTMPNQLTGEQCKWAAEQRMQLNMVDTGHPWHHLTANGVIVEPDPTLEYLLNRIPTPERAPMLEKWKERIIPTAPKAKPVNRKFYGFDPYEKQ